MLFRSMLEGRRSSLLHLVKQKQAPVQRYLSSTPVTERDRETETNDVQAPATASRPRQICSELGQPRFPTGHEERNRHLVLVESLLHSKRLRERRGENERRRLTRVDVRKDCLEDVGGFGNADGGRGIRERQHIVKHLRGGSELVKRNLESLLAARGLARCASGNGGTYSLERRVTSR